MDQPAPGQPAPDHAASIRPAPNRPAVDRLTIDEVRLTPILVADPPLLNTQGVHQPYTPRLIVEVVTRDGTVGIGETYGDAKYLESARPLADRLAGRSVADLNGLMALADGVAVDASRVDGAVDVGGLRGVQTADKLRLSVVSAFEVACLDALGRCLGLPVHALLGGKVRDRVEYSAYLFYKWAAHPAGVVAELDDWGAALDPAGIVAQARGFAERHGFTSFKLKGGVFPPDAEIAAVRALAEAFPGSRCGSTRTARGPCPPRCGWPANSATCSSTSRTRRSARTPWRRSPRTPPSRSPPTCA